MGRLIPLLFLIDVAFVAIALISCLSAEEDEIRTLPRLGWILIILFFPLVGPVAWFSAGRPLPASEGIGQLAGDEFRVAPAERPRPARRPPAPDDDPEFLRSLTFDVEQAKRDRELFSRWEDEIRRRERGEDLPS